MINKAQVAIVKSGSYNDDNVYKHIKGAVDLLGGINSFVKKGNKVLLKPNLLSGKPPEAGITTHPAVIKAVAKLVIEAGGIPFIGDSPGGRAINFEKVAGITGMKQAADELGIRLADFKDSVELSATIIVSLLSFLLFPFFFRINVRNVYLKAVIEVRVPW